MKPRDRNGNLQYEINAPRPLIKDHRNKSDSKMSFFENSTEIGRRGSGSDVSSAVYQVVSNSPTPPVVLIQPEYNNNNDDDVVVQLDENKTVYSKKIQSNSPASTTIINTNSA